MYYIYCHTFLSGKRYVGITRTSPKRRWSNAGEVERAGIASRSNVSKCCCGVPHVKTVGGFVWRFEE